MAALTVSATLLAGQALAVSSDGYQTIVDFEEFSTGTGGLYYDEPDTYILGGTVSAAEAFTAHSGSKVYVGTSISTRQTSGDFNFSGVDYWPGLGAYVSPGAATVFVTFYGFDPDDHMLHIVGSGQTIGTDANQFFSFQDLDGAAPDLLSMSFTSDSEFAVDDLLFGLPDVGPGIPEPSTWAMMLLGFAGLGSALRRQASRVRAS